MREPEVQVKRAPQECGALDLHLGPQDKPETPDRGRFHGVLGDHHLAGVHHQDPIQQPQHREEGEQLMTTTEPKRRHFQHVITGSVATPAPEHIAVYAKNPNYREVLIAPIPEIEVDEPDEDGAREVSVGGVRVALIYPGNTAADWRETRDYHLSALVEDEAIVRWIEAHPEPDPESVARVKAARDALAVLTDEERAEVLR